MKYNRLKGYTLVIVSSVILLAVLVFLILQWGSTAKFSLFGPEKQANTGLLILTSAVGGIVILYVCKMMTCGIALLRRTRETNPDQDKKQ